MHVLTLLVAIFRGQIGLVVVSGSRGRIVVAGLYLRTLHLPILVEARPVNTPRLIETLVYEEGVSVGMCIAVKVILSAFDCMIREHFIQPVSPLRVIINVGLRRQVLRKGPIIPLVITMPGRLLHHLGEDLPGFLAICSICLAPAGVLDLKTHSGLHLRRPEHWMRDPRPEKERLSLILRVVMVVRLRSSWGCVTPIGRRVTVVRIIG